MTADEEKARVVGNHDSTSAGAERRLTIIDNRLDSRDLFRGVRNIVIVHGRETYRLHLTAQNKLILTK